MESQTHVDEQVNDLEFLRDLRQCIQDGRQGDPTRMDLAVEMIDDWIDELEWPEVDDAEFVEEFLQTLDLKGGDAQAWPVVRGSVYAFMEWIREHASITLPGVEPEPPDTSVHALG